MEYIYLQGSETVHSAAVEMSRAAERLDQVARNFEGSVEHLTRVLEDFITRFEAAIENSADKSTGE